MRPGCRLRVTTGTWPSPVDFAVTSCQGPSAARLAPVRITVHSEAGTPLEQPGGGGEGVERVTSKHDERQLDLGRTRSPQCWFHREIQPRNSRTVKTLLPFPGVQSISTDPCLLPVGGQMDEIKASLAINYLEIGHVAGYCVETLEQREREHGAACRPSPVPSACKSPSQSVVPHFLGQVLPFHS